jgi:hypothetical protein
MANAYVPHAGTTAVAVPHQAAGWAGPSRGASVARVSHRAGVDYLDLPRRSEEGVGGASKLPRLTKAKPVPRGPVHALPNDEVVPLCSRDEPVRHVLEGQDFETFRWQLQCPECSAAIGRR